MNLVKKLSLKANKGRLHHDWGKIDKVKTWHILVLFVMVALLAAWALRQNNLKMIDLRQKLIQADVANSGTQEAASELSRFVSNHMNTNLGQSVQLVNSYNRDYRALIQDSEEVNGSIYDDAVQKCVNVNIPVTTQSECIKQEVEKNTANLNVGTVADLPIELYSINVLSPAWSPDLAGFSVLAAVLLFIALVIRFIAGLIVRSVLKSHR